MKFARYENRKVLKIKNPVFERSNTGFNLIYKFVITYLVFKEINSSVFVNVFKLRFNFSVAYYSKAVSRESVFFN